MAAFSACLFFLSKRTIRSFNTKISGGCNSKGLQEFTGISDHPIGAQLIFFRPVKVVFAESVFLHSSFRSVFEAKHQCFLCTVLIAMDSFLMGEDSKVTKRPPPPIVGERKTAERGGPSQGTSNDRGGSQKNYIRRSEWIFFGCFGVDFGRGWGDL